MIYLRKNKADFLRIGASWLGGLCLLLVACEPGETESALPQTPLPETVDFNFHIRPILSDRCYTCHGPDEKARKADLRLDVEAEAFSALDSLGKRFAIVPGDLEQSELVHRISSQDPGEMMPPPESNLSLSTYEIDLLKKWIAQGAEWKAHWAFIPPTQPPLPSLSDSSRVINAIDQFVMARLEQAGLSLSPEASKEKLIRRLSFDLRGLPPSLEEIDAFVNDPSPDAYEQWVDRFLAEASYGERMAMEWLDLARYADSHGYQDDLERSMWPWREWVIEAFNENMPYDRFVSWQLAGDLMPAPTYAQKLATAFNRNHKITQEVGVIDEEYRVNYVLDRVNTFSTAFLGLTVECAQCHDHKYDPISQRDYYRLFSFFNQVPEKGRVEYGVEVAAPFLPLPPAKIDSISAYIQGLYSDQERRRKQYAEAKWVEDSLLTLDTPRPDATPSLPEGLVVWYPFDYVENAQTPAQAGAQPASIHNNLVVVPGKFSGGLEFMGSNFAELKPKRSFDPSRPFSLSFWIKSLDGGIRGPILVSYADKPAGMEFQVTGDKKFRLVLRNRRTSSFLNLQSKSTLVPNQWVHVGLTYDGSRQGKGVTLYLDGKASEISLLKDSLRGNPDRGSRLLLGTRDPLIGQTQPDQDDAFAFFRTGLMAGQLDELMLFDRALAPEDIQALLTFHPLSALQAQAERSRVEQRRLFYHQLLHEDSTYQALTGRLREYRIREGRMHAIVLKPTMIMTDMDTVRPTYVLNRGQYDAPGERVEAGTPQAILPFDSTYIPNRLGLAHWLFSPNHPLTARVAVNRYWQLIFGRGLVATPEDFGSQGALPTHPALLDWLATEFQASGWNLKQLIKTLVLSATYRQSVRSNPKLEQLDPDNLLLVRGPQVRLPAEIVRDHALAISGLLSESIGGPSVKPYQPDGLWLQIASGNQALRKYQQDHGDELYRRSLYTFWKRTLPPPAMTVFDAPSREQCIMRRRNTSTPMQALVLLNDPQFTEASRLIATRMIRAGGSDDAARIQFAFRLATSRAATPEELALLEELLIRERADFATQPEAARQLLAIGEYPRPKDIPPVELAAYTVLANAILNLTETIMKG